MRGVWGRSKERRLRYEWGWRRKRWQEALVRFINPWSIYSTCVENTHSSSDRDLSVNKPRCLGNLRNEDSLECKLIDVHWLWLFQGCRYKAESTIIGYPNMCVCMYIYVFIKPPLSDPEQRAIILWRSHRETNFCSTSYLATFLLLQHLYIFNSKLIFYSIVNKI